MSKQRTREEWLEVVSRVQHLHRDIESIKKELTVRSYRERSQPVRMALKMLQQEGAKRGFGDLPQVLG